jgi:hypothetical protein
VTKILRIFAADVKSRASSDPQHVEELLIERGLEADHTTIWRGFSLWLRPAPTQYASLTPSSRRRQVRHETRFFTARLIRNMRKQHGQRQAARDALTAPMKAEAFIAGFEDDPAQDGVNQLPAEIRTAIRAAAT